MRTNLSQSKNRWPLLSGIIAFIFLLAGIGSFNWVLSHPPAEESLLFKQKHAPEKSFTLATKPDGTARLWIDDAETIGFVFPPEKQGDEINARAKIITTTPAEYIDESGTKKGVVHDVFEKPFSTKRGGTAILIVGVKLLEIKPS